MIQRNGTQYRILAELSKENQGLGELESNLGIPRRSLSSRLSELIYYGLIERAYIITDRGRLAMEQETLTPSSCKSAAEGCSTVCNDRKRALQNEA